MNGLLPELWYWIAACSGAAIIRFPDVEGDKKPNKKLKVYPIGFFHIDIAEVRRPKRT